MSTVEELSRILYEFSYRAAMQDIAFKPHAYLVASETVASLGSDLKDIWRKGGVQSLQNLPGIGMHIAEKIDEYFRTGSIQAYRDMKKEFPVDIWGLSRIEGLGPKHIEELYQQLNIQNIADLEAAIASHSIRNIPHWGEKSEEKLAHGLLLASRASDRHLLGKILPLAENIIAKLKKIKGVTRCVYAGSLRRKQETIGDIDLIITSRVPKKVMEAFVSLPEVEKILEHGRTRSSVRLSCGIDADLRIVPEKVFGATLQYFTGNKQHNIALRTYALSQGYTLNEYGLFTQKKGNKINTKPIACEHEEDIYDALHMDTPPPELRIGADEIKAAQQHKLPNLIPYHSIKGDLQVQTNWTDGIASIEDMVSSAKKYGLSYIAITDHTQALSFIHGLNEKQLAKQGKEIDELNKKNKTFTIFKGTECDILKDGTLDLSNTALKKLDWVGVSIHSHFTLSRHTQTKRIVQALSNSHVDCFFHPTARIIGGREPIDIDFDEILAAAKKYHVALEINATPERSDVRDILVRQAMRAGVFLVINSDAHAPEHFAYLKLGEAIARRGWATKQHIINTKSVAQFKAFLHKKSSHIH